MIGVHNDGTRVDIDESLSAERAKDIRSRLTSASTFQHVVIELEDPATKKAAPPGDGGAGDSVVFDLDDTAKAKPKPEPH